MAEPITFVAKDRRGTYDYRLTMKFLGIGGLELGGGSGQLRLDADPPGKLSAGGVQFIYESPEGNHYPQIRTQAERRNSTMSWAEWDRLVAWVSERRADAESSEGAPG